MAIRSVAMKPYIQLLLFALLCLLCLSASLPPEGAKGNKRGGGQGVSISKTLDEILDDLSKQSIKKIATREQEMDEPSKTSTKEASNESVDENSLAVIGTGSFSRAQVTDIGDLDGNGFNDFVVARPLVKNRTGTVRVYLMKENHDFLFSHELIPGQWGFNSTFLQEGDLYGSAVFKLPSTLEQSHARIAIGAPGDNSGEGAIYILDLTPSGTVSQNLRISPAEAALARQFDHKEGFGSKVSAVADLNGDGEFELVVTSLAGSSTLLFLDSDRKVRTALKLARAASGLLKHVERTKKTASLLPSKTRPVSLLDTGFLTVRTGLSAQCFFNETACACSTMSPEPGSMSCADVVGTDPGSGRTLCKPRDCAASYQCNCDGTEFCRRTKEMRTYHVIEGAAPSGDMFCSKTTTEMTINVVEPGVPIPTPDVIPELDSYNSTHCRCSLKSDVMGTSQCLDLVQTFSNGTSACCTRNCNIGSSEYTCDGAGDCYCERNFIQNNYWRSTGDLLGPGLQSCVLDTQTVEQLNRIL